MAQTVGKRYSNVRYWRYIFTPTIFLLMAFGLFMLYNSGSSTTTASFPTLTSILRKNVNASSMSAVTSQIQKYST